MAKSPHARKHAESIRSAAARLGAVRGGRARAPAELDDLIHERKRLAIVSALAGHDWLSFTELKALVETSDGNLSVHARKLEDAGYLECRKGFAGRVPRTDYRLTIARPPGARRVSRPHGSAHPPDARCLTPPAPPGLHLAVILDGNGRWATQRGLPRFRRPPGGGGGGAPAHRGLPVRAASGR